MCRKALSTYSKFVTKKPEVFSEASVQPANFVHTDTGQVLRLYLVYAMKQGHTDTEIFNNHHRLSLKFNCLKKSMCMLRLLKKYSMNICWILSFMFGFRLLKIL